MQMDFPIITIMISLTRTGMLRDHLGPKGIGETIAAGGTIRIGAISQTATLIIDVHTAGVGIMDFLIAERGNATLMQTVQMVREQKMVVTTTRANKRNKTRKDLSWFVSFTVRFDHLLLILLKIICRWSDFILGSSTAVGAFKYLII